MKKAKVKSCFWEDYMSGDTMVLYGKNSIFERVKANPRSVRKIFIRDGFDLPPDIKKIIRATNISLESLKPQELAKLKPVKDLQGLVARVNKFEYADFGDLLDRQEERPTLIFLDRINDPHNLGSIIRTVACFGGFSVVIPKFEACEVNETVLHVASGGENYVSVAMVSNIANAVIAAKQAGYWIIGAVVSDDAQQINKISLPFPLAVVFGSEGEGIRYGIQKHLDIKAHIPMQQAKLSFNVTMACAIFCYEIAGLKNKP